MILWSVSSVTFFNIIICIYVRINIQKYWCFKVLYWSNCIKSSICMCDWRKRQVMFFCLRFVSAISWSERVASRNTEGPSQSPVQRTLSGQTSHSHLAVHLLDDFISTAAAAEEKFVTLASISNLSTPYFVIKQILFVLSEYVI